MCEYIISLCFLEKQNLQEVKLVSCRHSIIYCAVSEWIVNAHMARNARFSGDLCMFWGWSPTLLLCSNELLNTVGKVGNAETYFCLLWAYIGVCKSDLRSFLFCKSWRWLIPLGSTTVPFCTVFEHRGFAPKLLKIWLSDDKPTLLYFWEEECVLWLIAALNKR